MDCSMPGLPVPYHLLEFASVHVRWIVDAIQLSHPLSPTSPSAFNLAEHQGVFEWVDCLQQVAKVLKHWLQAPSALHVFLRTSLWGTCFCYYLQWGSWNKPAQLDRGGADLSSGLFGSICGFFLLCTHSFKQKQSYCVIQLHSTQFKSQITECGVVQHISYEAV